MWNLSSGHLLVQTPTDNYYVVFRHRLRAMTIKPAMNRKTIAPWNTNLETRQRAWRFSSWFAGVKFSDLRLHNDLNHKIQILRFKVLVWFNGSNIRIPFPTDGLPRCMQQQWLIWGRYAKTGCKRSKVMRLSWVEKFDECSQNYSIQNDEWNVREWLTQK